jgi:hypothetical protein
MCLMLPRRGRIRLRLVKIELVDDVYEYQAI